MKTSRNWNVAATHYLTGGLVTPAIISAILGVVLAFLVKDLPVIIKILIGLIIGILSIWLGVMYSASYIRKHYYIIDRDKVILLSTVYFVIVGIIIEVIGFTFNLLILVANNLARTSPAGSALTLFDYLILFAFFVVKVYCFNYFSKIYLPESSSPQPDLVVAQ